jgi:bifunctional non-homologous end joining protein LigD
VKSWRPQPLIRVDRPFDARDWLFELKHDGFRAFAIITGHQCTLVSRRGHVFKQWPQLAEELAHTVKADHAVLDGEIVCLNAEGGSDFHRLLFRREWPFFFAFDLLTVDGEDIRARPLVERKRRLRRLMPRHDSRLRYVDHIQERGRDLFDLACRHDAEGIVGKWDRGVYHVDGATTSWLKVKNPDYTQAVGRHELFESRRGGSSGRSASKGYRLDPAASSAARSLAGRSHRLASIV